MEQNAPQDTIKTEPNTVKDTQPTANKGYKIAIAIMVLLTACGAGFGIWGVINSNNKSSEISSLKDQIRNFEDNNSTLETEENNVVADTETITETTVETATSGFDSFSNNLLSKIKSLDNSVACYKQEIRVLSTNESSFRATIEKDASLTLSWNGNTATLANDVLDFEFVEFGNGIDDIYLYFINKDGSVSRTENLKDTKNAVPAIVNNIGGFKGVISVETTRGNYPQGVDGYYAIFTDFNGNILSE